MRGLELMFKTRLHQNLYLEFCVEHVITHITEGAVGLVLTYIRMNNEVYI
jgi:hypothetical protein